MKKEFLTYSQVAEKYNIKRNTLYALVSNKQIPHYKVSKRIIRFSISDLDNWFNKGFVKEKK